MRLQSAHPRPRGQSPETCDGPPNAQKGRSPNGRPPFGRTVQGRGGGGGGQQRCLTGTETEKPRLRRSRPGRTAPSWGPQGLPGDYITPAISGTPKRGEEANRYITPAVSGSPCWGRDGPKVSAKRHYSTVMAPDMYVYACICGYVYATHTRRIRDVCVHTSTRERACRYTCLCVYVYAYPDTISM